MAMSWIWSVCVCVCGAYVTALQFPGLHFMDQVSGWIQLGDNQWHQGNFMALALSLGLNARSPTELPHSPAGPWCPLPF